MIRDTSGVRARGSALYLALSRDGALAFAGCKATHAGVFGSGGDLYMIETRAQRLRIEGQPALGGKLDLSIHSDPAFSAAIRFGGLELAAGPGGAPALDSLGGVRLLGAFQLREGGLRTSFPMPASSALADTTVHAQAVLLGADLREATNKVSLHVLP